jgi:hypothetical protein
MSVLVLFGVGFILLWVSGFWLGKIGKPYNMILLSIHKLISLAALVYFMVTVFQIHKLTPLSPLEITLSVTSILLVVALITSGGLISALKTVLESIRIVHKILPSLAVLSTAVALCVFQFSH